MFKLLFVFKVKKEKKKKKKEKKNQLSFFKTLQKKEILCFTLFIFYKNKITQ